MIVQERKYLKFKLFIIYFLFLQNIMAQDTLNIERKGFAVKIDLIGIASLAIFPYHYLSLTAEKPFKKNQSFQISYLKVWYNGDYRKYNTTQFIPEYKYYFNKNEIVRGFFAGLYAKYTKYH